MCLNVRDSSLSTTAPFPAGEHGLFNFSMNAIEMYAVRTIPRTQSSVCINQTWFYCILGVRSSHRPVNSSTTEKKPLASSPTSAFASATVTGSGGRPPRSATGSSTWAAEDSMSSSGTYRTLGMTRSSPAPSVGETHGVRGSRETTDFTEGVADTSLTSSHSALEGPSPGELKSAVKCLFFL